jgi:hypothetical protein
MKKKQTHTYICSSPGLSTLRHTHHILTGANLFHSKIVRKPNQIAEQEHKENNLHPDIWWLVRAQQACHPQHIITGMIIRRHYTQKTPWSTITINIEIHLTLYRITTYRYQMLKINTTFFIASPTWSLSWPVACISYATCDLELQNVISFWIISKYIHFNNLFRKNIYKWVKFI